MRLVLGSVAAVAVAFAAAQGGQYTVQAKISTSQEPQAVALDAWAGRLYVAHLDNKTVSVISTATDTVIKTIKVGESPRGIAADPRTGRVYVANAGSGTISVIGVRADKVIATIKAGPGSPWGVDVDPVTNLIYVADQVHPCPQGQVLVISGQTQQVTATVALPACPFAIAVNPRTDHVYATGQGMTPVINGHDNALVKVIRGTPLDLVQIGVDTRTNRVYVTGEDSGQVTVINGRTQYNLGSFGVCRNPFGISVNQAADLLYIACVTENDLSVIDAATTQQVTTAPAGAAPVGVTYFRGIIYESNAADPDVWVISTPS